MVGDDRGGLTLVRHACNDLTFALAQPRLGFLTEFFSFPMPGVAGFVGKQPLRSVEHAISLPVQQTTSPARSTAACMVWPRIIATLGPLLRLSCAPSPLGGLLSSQDVSRDGASARLTWSGWRSGRGVRTGRRRRPRCRS